MDVINGPCINTLRPRQNGRHFADDTFKLIFVNANVRISIKISLKLVPKGPIYNIPALVQIMAWRRPGDKPLFEPMIISLPTHICVTRPQWVNLSQILLVHGHCWRNHVSISLASTDWGNGLLQAVIWNNFVHLVIWLITPRCHLTWVNFHLKHNKQMPLKCRLQDVSHFVNSSPLSAAYMRQWTVSELVQIMACCLFGAKPLSKPVLGYCQLDP